MEYAVLKKYTLSVAEECWNRCSEHRCVKFIRCLPAQVSLPAYWLANLTWDLAIYCVPLGLSLLFVQVFSISARPPPARTPPVCTPPTAWLSNKQ